MRTTTVVIAALFVIALAHAASATSILAYPLYAADEGTPFTVRVAFNGSANTAYYIKGYFFMSGSTNTFGYTWNPENVTWVRDSDAYANQRIVTTDAAGAWSSWIYVKSNPSDTGYTGAGTYNFRVRARQVGTSTDSDATTNVTIIDMTSQGGWLAGYATNNDGSAAENKIVMTRNENGTVVGTYSTEDNGVVEGYSGAGYFKLSAPVGSHTIAFYFLNETKIGESRVNTSAGVVTSMNITAFAPPVHDVAVSDIVLSQESPVEGNDVMVTAYILNKGNREEGNVDVRFYLDSVSDSTLFDDKIAAAIAPNVTMAVAATWVAVAGGHRIYVTANVSLDNNTDDNFRTKQITVANQTQQTTQQQNQTQQTQNQTTQTQSQQNQTQQNQTSSQTQNQTQQTTQTQQGEEERSETTGGITGLATANATANVTVVAGSSDWLVALLVIVVLILIVFIVYMYKKSASAWKYSYS